MIMKRKGFVAALMLCLISALALTAGIVYNKNSKEKNPELADLNETKEEQTQEEVKEIVENNTSRPIDDQKKRAEANTTEQVTKESTVQPETQPQTQKTTQANATINALHFNESSSLSWPVTGEIILEYNMDNTIYFPTLDVYKCNPGMMIQGDENMPVCAAGEGVVKDVSVDREFGNMVTVDMGDGYTATYGQLDNVTMKKGQSVEKGQQIGTLAAPTAYYEVEGYNLYFKVMKDNNPVNPLDFLKE